MIMSLPIKQPQLSALVEWHRWRRCCCIVIASAALVLLLLVTIALILAFTLFKPKGPTTTLQSMRVSGVTPRLSFPAVSVQLNVSLDLLLLVHNPNRAAFRHDPGESFVTYRGIRVGEADLAAGRVPARGSETILCLLTIQVEKLASDVGGLLNDLVLGQVGLDTTMRIPGRVNILGIIKRHVVAVVRCHVDIRFPNLRIRRQDCQHQTKM